MRSTRERRCLGAAVASRPPAQAMAKIIKETMDRKYGPQWHCAIGEGFGST